MTQQQLARRVGCHQSSISRLETGRGGSLSVDVWQRVSLAVGRPLRLELERDASEEPSDAGHLRVQELILRVGRACGYQGRFELATRPSDPSRSADVGLRDDRNRRLLLIEAWNTFGDIGASARSFDRKLAEAERVAVAIGGADPYDVRGCWVVRASRRNRTLVARYPEVFAARFPGSSVAWGRALTTGSQPPTEPGLVWCDVGASRLFAWRRG